MDTTVFFDTTLKGFFDASGSATTLTDLLKGCDRANLCLSAGTFGDDKEFNPTDLSGYAVELGFFRKEACPQKGTVTFTVGADTTEEVSPSLSAKALEGFLNALPSVTNAGGLTVRVSDCNQGPVDTSESAGCCQDSGVQEKGPLKWDICWKTKGDKPDITVNTVCLWPPTVATVIKTREGDADCTEIAQVKLREKLLAYTGDAGFTAKPDSVISVTEVQAGGSGNNAVQRITISPAPVGGTFGPLIGGCKSNLISVFASADEFQDALKCPDEYTVTKTGDFQWDVTYVADQAAHTLLTIDCNFIRSSGGVEGTFNLNTDIIQSLLNGCDEIEGTVELVLTENGSGTRCRYEESFTVTAGQIDTDQPGAPIPSGAIPLFGVATDPGARGDGTAGDPLKLTFCEDVNVINGNDFADITALPMTKRCDAIVIQAAGDPRVWVTGFDSAQNTVFLSGNTTTGNYQVRVSGHN